MKQLLKQYHWVMILLGVLVSISAQADVWANPKIKSYYSENKLFKLVITPTITPAKYYQWKYFQSNQYPQTNKLLRKKLRFMKSISEVDTIQIPCMAEFYRINETDSTLIWGKKLLNDICPAYAVVANDGSSIATFDNWYSTGYGVNAFVIYDENGSARMTYKLEEISPFPLNEYMISVSSLHWNKGDKYIDNERIEIIFGTEDNRQAERIYNTKKLKFEK